MKKFLVAFLLLLPSVLKAAPNYVPMTWGTYSGNPSAQLFTNYLCFIDNTCYSSTSLSPPGNNGELVFNDSGAWGSSPNLFFNSGTNVLTLTGDLPVSGEISSATEVTSPLVTLSTALTNPGVTFQDGVNIYQQASNHLNIGILGSNIIDFDVAYIQATVPYRGEGGELTFNGQQYTWPSAGLPSAGQYLRATGSGGQGLTWSFDGSAFTDIKVSTLLDDIPSGAISADGGARTLSPAAGPPVIYWGNDGNGAGAYYYFDSNKLHGDGSELTGINAVNANYLYDTAGTPLKAVDGVDRQIFNSSENLLIDFSGANPDSAPYYFTALQLTGSSELLSTFVGDGGGGGNAGVVPAPTAGDAGGNKYLHANGSFMQVQKTYNNAGNTFTDGTDHTIMSSNGTKVIDAENKKLNHPTTGLEVLDWDLMVLRSVGSPGPRVADWSGSYPGTTTGIELGGSGAYFPSGICTQAGLAVLVGFTFYDGANQESAAFDSRQLKASSSTRIMDWSGANPDTAPYWFDSGDSYNLVGSGERLTIPAAKHSIRTITTNDTALLTDYTILIDASGGNVTLTLPTAAAAFDSPNGLVLNVKRIDNSINTVTVDADGSETIDGAANFLLATQFLSRTIQSAGGSEWYVLSIQ